VSATVRREREENQLKHVDNDEDRVPGDDVSTTRDRGTPDNEASAAGAQQQPEHRNTPPRGEPITIQCPRKIFYIAAEMEQICFYQINIICRVGLKPHIWQISLKQLVLFNRQYQQ